MKAHATIEDGAVVVVIEFHNGMAGNAVWKFSNNCGNRYYAGLAADALQNQFQDMLCAIRQDAYEDGYKDAKAKRKRKDCFSGCLS